MMNVYILESIRSQKYYIGYTNDLERRLSEHNDVSRKGWTRIYAPWRIIYSRICETRADAMKEEKHLKSFKNRATLEKYLQKG